MLQFIARNFLLHWYVDARGILYHLSDSCIYDAISTKISHFSSDIMRFYCAGGIELLLPRRLIHSQWWIRRCFRVGTTWMLIAEQLRKKKLRSHITIASFWYNANGFETNLFVVPLFLKPFFCLWVDEPWGFFAALFSNPKITWEKTRSHMVSFRPFSAPRPWVMQCHSFCIKKSRRSSIECLFGKRWMRVGMKIEFLCCEKHACCVSKLNLFWYKCETR